MNKSEEKVIKDLENKSQAWARILLRYIRKLEKENEELQKENEELQEQRDNAIKLRNELIEEQKITCISKNKIRNKIKEVAEEPQIYVDTEKFDKEFEKSNYIIEVLKELLGE